MKKDHTTYRWALGVAVAAAFMLFWVTGAVGLIGVEGDPFDRWYGGVVMVGVIGAVIARFRPQGMAWAMFATAGAQALVTVIALVIGKQHSPVTSVGEILGLNGFYFLLWVWSAWLFRKAGKERVPAVAGQEA